MPDRGAGRGAVQGRRLRRRQRASAAPSVAALKNIYDAGVEVSSIQVGGLGGGPERKVVFQNITLDDADANALGELADKGVDIVFQTIPEDAPQGIEAILKKYRG